MEVNLPLCVGVIAAAAAAAAVLNPPSLCSCSIFNKETCHMIRSSSFETQIFITSLVFL